MYNQIFILVKNCFQTQTGSDVADLLLDGHEPTAADYAKPGMSLSMSDKVLVRGAESDSTVTSDRSLVNQMEDLSLHNVTDRFRHLLLHGRKKVCTV